MRNRAVLFARPRTSQTEDDGLDREEEVLAAMDAESAWVDLELIVDGRPETACEDLPEGRTWIYRGWMLSEEEYESLDEAVREKRGRLFVSPDAYARATYVPEWAPALGSATPRTVWTEGDDLDDAWEAASVLRPPPWIVKDHVKSVKEEWDTCCFIPASADAGRSARARFDAIVSAMIEARGDRFERGVVVREYEAPRTLGYRLPEREVPDEHRVFFVRRRLVAQAPYFDVEADPLSDAELHEITNAARGIRSPFFSLDVMRAADGRVRIIEVNDGGVSTLPAQLDPRELYEALLDVR